MTFHEVLKIFVNYLTYTTNIVSTYKLCFEILITFFHLLQANL